MASHLMPGITILTTYSVDNLPVAAMQSLGTSSVFAVDVGSVRFLDFEFDSLLIYT
jgi:hypothetical protein